MCNIFLWLASIVPEIECVAGLGLYKGLKPALV